MTDTRLRFGALVLCRGALFATLAWVAQGCASSPDNHLYRPEAANFQRSLVLPLNVVVALPSELNDGADRVEDALHGYLVDRGKSIDTIARAKARAAWLESANECLSQPNQACDGFEGAAGVLARRLRDGRNFEVLIIPYLLFRTAEGGANKARWDGVERSLEKAGWGLRPGGPMVVTRVTMRAASLAVFAFSREGDKMFEGLGGLDLVDRVRAPGGPLTMTHELREDLFNDRALLLEGVAVAFDPLVPRGEP